MSIRTVTIGLGFVVALACALVLAGLPDGFGGQHPKPAFVRQVDGSVSHVRDGDTIELAGTVVRVANLDCPELDTEAGQRARERMIQLVSGRAVVCRLEGRPSDEGELGACALASADDGLDEMLIADGTCGRWRSQTVR